MAAVLFVVMLTPALGSAEAEIQQFFPNAPALLGRPLFWLIEIRHPMWEFYELNFGACSGVEMSVSDRKMTEIAGEVRAFYKIAVTPVALRPSCTPSIMISNEKGQTIVLSGKALHVQTISGNSLAIKDPAIPMPVEASSTHRIFLYSLLGILFVLSAYVIFQRFYQNLPSQTFLREIRKALREVQKDKLPIQVWRLLRSEMVWGFRADVFTPAQLQRQETHDPRLTAIAHALQGLESWRYAGSTSWDRTQVTKALTNAEGIARERKLWKELLQTRGPQHIALRRVR